MSIQYITLNDLKANDWLGYKVGQKFYLLRQATGSIAAKSPAQRAPPWSVQECRLVVSCAGFAQGTAAAVSSWSRREKWQGWEELQKTECGVDFIKTLCYEIKQ